MEKAGQREPMDTRKTRSLFNAFPPCPPSVERYGHEEMIQLRVEKKQNNNDLNFPIYGYCI